MALLTCIAGSLAYHQQLGEALIWLGQQISDTPQTPPQPNGEPASFAPTTQSPSASDAPKRQDNSSSALKSPRNEDAPAAPAPNSDSNSEISASKSVEVPPVTQSPGPATARSPAPPTVVPTIQQNRREPSPAPAESAPEPGQVEFEQARQLLRAGRNSGVRAEIPEAARLLWAAVEKGNVSAELALAELYRTGNGVTKNCEQTRILLTAAARKGSLEAQRKLHDLLQHPCS
jgi:TPR repeat protein